MSTERNLPTLPSAFEFIYEFPSPMGGVHRKLTMARWNGNKASAAFTVYTAEQMHAYAEASIDRLIETAAQVAQDAAISYEQGFPVNFEREIREKLAAGIDASEGGEKDDLESAPPKVLREFARFYRQTVFLQIKELDDALSEIRNLREFAKEIMGGWPDVGGLDGFDLQLLGVKHGLLREEIRHERCGEHCSCASDAMPTEAEWKAGVQCYRKTSLLTGVGDMAGEERT